MHVLLINPTLFGQKTKILIENFKGILETKDSSYEIDVLEFKGKDIQFSDGRNYMDYQGDTLAVVSQVMQADVIVIATPTYQASIPAPLKNLFDLLPESAFLNKTIGLLVNAGSEKHYLVAQQQLIPILQFMKANVITQIVFATPLDFVQENIVNDDLRFRMDRLADDLAFYHQVTLGILEKQDELYDF